MKLVAAQLRSFVLILLSVASAQAQSRQPSATNCTVPSVIVVVGSTGGVADPKGSFPVVVRNAAGAPIVGTKVEIRIEVREMIIAPLQPPGVTVLSCYAPRLQATTDATGTATFVVMGSVNRDLDYLQYRCRIYAGDTEDTQVFIGTPIVAGFDQDGVNGVGANDVSLWLSDFASGLTYGRSDFNGSGNLSQNDMNLLLSACFDGGSQQTPARCDAAPTVYSPDVVRGGLRLSWSMCRGDGGAPLTTSACNSNAGSNALVASFIAPIDVSSVTGIEATVDVYGNSGEALPSWWHLEPGGCRSSAGSLIFTNSGNCDDALNAITGGSRWYSPTQVGAASRSRLRVIGAAPAASTVDLFLGQEYFAFKALISNANTTGAGLCADCAKPVALVLRSIRLTHTSGVPDVVIYPLAGEDALRVVYWQGVPSGFTVGP
jgi:hypothetical protein